MVCLDSLNFHRKSDLSIVNVYEETDNLDWCQLHIADVFLRFLHVAQESSISTNFRKMHSSCGYSGQGNRLNF